MDWNGRRSEEHTSELQSLAKLVCRLLLEKKKNVICIDARHAKTALKMQINKSDRNDAVGISRIMQCGCFFFNDTATTEIYTLSLLDALPIFFFTVPCGCRPRTLRLMPVTGKK